MSSTSSTSNCQPSEQEYEIFLSFRGPDTRVGFTDHLYERLIAADIKVYRDDEELRKGEKIGLGLLQAINRSIVAIPIFSKSYAESTWCLKELVEIVKCTRSKGMKVMPIFYNVTPSEVRNQSGNYKKAFELHEQSYKENDIREWKEALSEIGTLSGWEIPNSTYSREGKLVEDVTEEMLCALKKAYLKIPNHLVGLSHHVENLLKMLSDETHGVQIIGIHGMGGIGKTTLAKFIYNHLLPNFERSSFLADVRSKDIELLKKNLLSDILNRKLSNHIDREAITIAKRLSDKKVLVVLDDVDQRTPIEDLIGEWDKQDQFGFGSKIIVTTRDSDILRRVHVHGSYELREMDYHHALQLFYRHAFSRGVLEMGYDSLSKEMVETTGGLPLAVEVIGSLLRNKCKEEWERKLEKLKKVPAKDVSRQLRISFEDLDERQKHIFLDIACFFIGADQRVVIHFWDPNQFPKEAVDVLQQKSLMKIHDNLFWMHDQLRDLGREITCENCIVEPERQIRFWNEEEATKIFMTKKGIWKVQGICLKLNEKSKPYFSYEGFRKIPDVRFLSVHDALFDHKQSSRISIPKFFSKKQPCILSELRWLSWPSFSHTYVETREFSLSSLAVLDLTQSTISIHWAGWSHIKMAKNLKVLNLSKCKNLVKTPEFSSHLLLERLILEECSALVEIDKSIGMLEHLVHLNLRKCSSLCRLPTELSCMGSLTELLIDETSIVEIPHWCSMVNLEIFSAQLCGRLENCISLNNLTSLKKLLLSASRITLIPDSIGELVNLLELRLWGCKFLKKLPESIGSLVSLIQLDISRSGIEELPNSIGYLKNLKQLRMSGTSIGELPLTIGMAKKLEEIDAEDCKFLRGFPMLPQSLINLMVSSDCMQTIPDLSNLINLKRLVVFLSFDNMPLIGVECASLWWIGKLSKLEDLTLGGFNMLQSIPQLPSSLTKMIIFAPRSFERLCDLSHLKMLSTLKIVDTHLMKLEGLHVMKSLQMLILNGCVITEIDDLPENLRILEISNCGRLKRLSQMSICKKLKEFNLLSCPNLVEIHGRLESIESLDIEDCKSLEKIPDVLNVKTLSLFSVRGCPKLCDGMLSSKGPLFIDDLSVPEENRRTLMKICGYDYIKFFNKEVEGKRGKMEKLD